MKKKAHLKEKQFCFPLQKAATQHSSLIDGLATRSLSFQPMSQQLRPSGYSPIITNYAGAPSNQHPTVPEPTTPPPSYPAGVNLVQSF